MLERKWEVSCNLALLVPCTVILYLHSPAVQKVPVAEKQGLLEIYRYGKVSVVV